MATLYRKYRPQNFSEIAGQNHIKITLQNELAMGKIAHAYLFCGPRGVGKTTMARVLAKSLNCLKRKEKEFEPCNTCEVCLEITEGRSLDVIEIDAASNTGVDNVRDNIIASARVVPIRNKTKIFIVDEVHMLSISAFNALLKIMEEPPSFVFFILCTTEAHKVPNTIISRCQRFDFKRIEAVNIVKKLTYIAKADDILIEPEILETIARVSEGHMRDAVSMLGQLISLGGKKITQVEADLVIPRSDMNEIISLIECLSKKNASQGVALINSLLDNGVDLKNFSGNLIEILRKMLISKINPALGEKLGIQLGETAELKLNEVAREVPKEKIAIWIEKFNEARNKIRESFIIQMPLELAVIDICLSDAVANQTRPIFNNTVRQPISPVSAKTAMITKATVDSSAAVKVSPEQVREKWSEILVKIKKYNHSLSFILRACEPRSINNGQLCLAFKYKFHKERVNSPQIKPIVENVFSEVFGAPICFDVIVDESLAVGNFSEEPEVSSEPPIITNANANKPPKEEAANNGIDNLLKTFGGRIVK
jgi:DNA polymerase-3 subunit gamma/tau